MGRARFESMLLLLAIGCFFGAGDCAAGKAARPAEPDSLEHGRSSLVALPYAFYTPETKAAFGVGAIYSFRFSGSSPAGRPSNVRAAITYTQLHQLIIGLLPELYLRDESCFVDGFLGYYRYPDKFWGIGSSTPGGAEEDFEPLILKARLSFQKRVRTGLYMGVLYQYEYIDLKKTGPDGFLRSGAVPGSEGCTVSGLGLIFNHDTRNHVYQPSAGFYNQVRAVFHNRAFGSGYDFNLLSIDLRAYAPLFDTHVVAFQMHNGFLSGDAPFHQLNLLGGADLLRGYYEGRYRDRHMLTFQAEYRFPLAWRLGGVGFAGIGDVGDSLRDFRLDEFKYSFGAGLRLMFDRRERINARLDIGCGGGGEIGIYALVLEAF